MHSYDPTWLRMKYGSFARSMVSSARRRRRSRRSIASFCADATPALPTLLPCSRASMNDMAKPGGRLPTRRSGAGRNDAKIVL